MKRILLLFFILCCFSISPCHSKKPLQVKVMTYNLRFGELATLEQIAGHIKSFNPDFVALQEVDVRTCRARAPHQNGKDFIAELAQRTGMFGLYGKTIDYRGGYYGIGILSKYPYIEVRKTLLPNYSGSIEQRALLTGLFDVAGDTICFACTHLEVSSPPLRLTQAKFITNHFKVPAYKYPVIIGGDFNAKNNSDVIRHMKENWQLATGGDNTFPASRPSRKIDYLFAYPKQSWRVVWSQTIRSVLSDHLPIVSLLEYTGE